MSGFLFTSRVREKILAEFFARPRMMLYGRQLTRDLGEQSNAIRRELLNLEKEGVLKSEKRGNRVYFSLNPDHLFFPELEAIFAKKGALGGAMIKNRGRLGKIKAVFLTRRFLRQMPRQESEEINILVVGEVILPELAALVSEEEKRRGEEINYTVMDEKEFRFRLAGKDPFLADFLIKPRVTILGDELSLLNG
ncbi:winged helix-turn-helix transcriptional regulator [Candidatus Shapirobacteria bacterium]|nr:winged helix-turn-helix transcriptional regulator [Candidatus Shapirobacteria bacterium]